MQVSHKYSAICTQSLMHVISFYVIVKTFQLQLKQFRDMLPCVPLNILTEK